MMPVKIYETIIKQKKVLIAFAEMIADMDANKKIKQTVAKLFLRGRKLNISIFLITIFAQHLKL